MQIDVVPGQLPAVRLWASRYLSSGATHLVFVLPRGARPEILEEIADGVITPLLQPA